MRRLAPATLLALALALAAARADDDAASLNVLCPLDGERFSVHVAVSSNEAGGRDSDGCRWAIDREGRLEVLELRDIIACPRCQAAFYRGRIEAVRALHRRADEAAIASALAAAGPLDGARFETTVAHAVATARALPSSEDPDALEGRLWLRAAWAVRQRLVRDDDAPPLPIVFAPRSAEDAAEKLVDLERQAVSAAPGSGVGTPVEDALGSLDQARSVLDPLDKDKDEPSRRLAFERVRGALDLVEQTLLILRANLRTDREVDLTGRQARAFALAIARAAHRAGDGPRREQWLLEAVRGDVAPDIRASADRLRAWARAEERLLGLASAALERAGDRVQGERRSELLALAADAERRRVLEPASEHVEKARALAQRAADGSGRGARLAAFLLERLGR